MVYLEHLDRINFLWIAGFAWVAYSLLQIMFYKNQNGSSYQLLKQILIEGNLEEKYFTTANCTFLSKKLSIVKVIQLFSVISRNFMQLIIFGWNFHMINMQFYFWGEFSKENLFKMKSGLWLYLFSMIQSSLVWISTRRILSTLFLLATHGLSLYFLLFILPRQLLTLVADIETQNQKQQNIFSTGHRLRNFFSRNSAYIRLLGDGSRLYGTATFRFFLVAYPQNAHLLMCLLLEKSGVQSSKSRSTSFRVGISMLLAQQLIVIFLVHVFSARLATAVHRPVRPMNGLFMGSLKSHLCFSFRTRFKMAAYLQHFNVVNRYGLSYGRMGAVTYSSFGKSMVFYWKFLIYAYKLFS